jgi:hypothetical protein
MLVLCLALMAAAAPSAARAGLLSAADEAELAQTLAEAREEQDICYGWNVRNNFTTNDVGSSLGPQVELDPGRCPRYVVLHGYIEYTCDSCDAEDSASLQIDTNVPNPFSVRDLERLGWKQSDLLGDKDDVALFNMVDALPLLAAQHGNAPYLTPDLEGAPPAGDRATDHPGADWLRDTWKGLLVAAFFLVGGAGWWFYQRRQHLARTRPTPVSSTPVQED